MASYYVDPSIDANTGAGTVGDPYGDLQYCLDTITRDSSAGDRINVKAGTAEVLSATLSIATYGTPSFGAGLVFAGYTSSEGDGGTGAIDGNGSHSIWNLTSVEGISFCNMDLGNCGSSVVLAFDRFCSVKDCKVHTTTGNGITGQAGLSRVWLDNIGGVGCSLDTQSAYDCFFTNSTNKFTSASQAGNMNRCCFKLDSTSVAIDLSTNRVADINHCSFYTSGTGQAIKLRPIYSYSIEGCLVQGFATGIDYSSTTEKSTAGHNYCAFYDNTTDADSTELSTSVGNESLGANLFDLSGSITSFADRLTYFNPVDQGNVYTDMPGGLAKGAVQPASGGGSAPYNPFAAPYQFGART